jgi:hypothetical protein
MIVRSPTKQQSSSTAAAEHSITASMMWWWCCGCGWSRRGKLFGCYLPLSLAALAWMRFAVLTPPQLQSSKTIVSTADSSSALVNAVVSSSSNDLKSSPTSLKSKQLSASRDDSKTANDDDDAAARTDDEDLVLLLPKVVWLASYPNSGTSYTMTLVERASNLSTATNYGAEVTYQREDSLAIYPSRSYGPFWEGLSGKRGRPRLLPTTNVLTKTHCGGRCIKCDANEYVVPTVDSFVEACQRTTHRYRGSTMESSIPAHLVHGMVHLLRNPYHNTVARFHLERRNMIAKKAKLERKYPHNATGFARWCHYLDTKYASFDAKVFDVTTLALLQPVPCHAEFFKWTQWHNLALETARRLGPTTRTSSRSTKSAGGVPVHFILYEDYEVRFNETLANLMTFLQLPISATQFQSFRNLPTYDDHYTLSQRSAIQALIQHVASPELWPLIRHYFA